MLNGFVDRYAVLARETDLIRLFAGGVDALSAGCLLGLTNRTDDVASLLAAELFAQEVVGVDRDEEVTEMERNLFAVLALAGQHVAVVAILQNRGQELNEHRKAVALVSAERLADAAQRRQSFLAAADCLQRRARVAGYRLAVFADDRAGMQLFADALIVLELAVLGDRGRAVKVEIKRLVGRNAQGWCRTRRKRRRSAQRSDARWCR